MKTESFQHKIDLLVDKTTLRFVPDWFKPNYFTYIRLTSVPFVFFLLQNNDYKSALVLFVFSAYTDTIDGALARTRNQITDLGKVIDPIADKALILTILLFIGFDYLIVKLFFVVILFEILANLFAAMFAKYIGRPLGANVFGKIKMILQCVSVALFLTGLILDLKSLVLVSEYTLFAALFFAILSGLEQLRRKIIKAKQNLEIKKEA